jgi:hypothetical protein
MIVQYQMNLIISNMYENKSDINIIKYRITTQPTQSNRSIFFWSTGPFDHHGRTSRKKNTSIALGGLCCNSIFDNINI